MCSTQKKPTGQNTKKRWPLHRRNAQTLVGKCKILNTLNIEYIMLIRLQRDILLRNGSAADAAIAMLFCGGATSPHTHGLGGGFVATIYTRSTQVAESLIARETAPAAANVAHIVSNVTGATSVAVPGELKGYAELHARYGRLEWSELVQPTIDLCRNGVMVSSALARHLEQFKDEILRSPDLAEIFINEGTELLYQEHDIMFRPKLADTLKMIANDGAESMYSINGELGASISAHVQQQDGFLQMQDFLDYAVRWERPVESDIYQNMKMYSAPLPASGSLLTFLLHFVSGFLPANNGELSFFSRLVEGFKFTYAKRGELGDSHFEQDAALLASKLNDIQYAKSEQSRVDDGETSQAYNDYNAVFAGFLDYGAAHVSVLASCGDAVSVTSTINRRFVFRDKHLHYFMYYIYEYTYICLYDFNVVVSVR